MVERDTLIMQKATRPRVLLYHQKGTLPRALLLVLGLCSVLALASAQTTMTKAKNLELFVEELQKAGVDFTAVKVFMGPDAHVHIHATAAMRKGQDVIPIKHGAVLGIAAVEGTHPGRVFRRVVDRVQTSVWLHAHLHRDDLWGSATREMAIMALCIMLEEHKVKVEETHKDHGLPRWLGLVPGGVRGRTPLGYTDEEWSELRGGVKQLAATELELWRTAAVPLCKYIALDGDDLQSEAWCSANTLLRAVDTVSVLSSHAHGQALDAQEHLLQHFQAAYTIYLNPVLALLEHAPLTDHANVEVRLKQQRGALYATTDLAADEALLFPIDPNVPTHESLLKTGTLADQPPREHTAAIHFGDRRSSFYHGLRFRDKDSLDRMLHLMDEWVPGFSKLGSAHKRMIAARKWLMDYLAREYPEPRLLDEARLDAPSLAPNLRNALRMRVRDRFIIEAVVDDISNLILSHNAKMIRDEEEKAAARQRKMEL